MIKDLIITHSRRIQLRLPPMLESYPEMRKKFYDAFMTSHKASIEFMTPVVVNGVMLGHYIITDNSPTMQELADAVLFTEKDYGIAELPLNSFIGLYGLKNILGGTHD